MMIILLLIILAIVIWGGVTRWRFVNGSGARENYRKIKLSDILDSHENSNMEENFKTFNIKGLSDGGINPGDRRTLFSLLKYFKPQKYLETGTHIGSSIITAAQALPSSSELITVDLVDVNLNKPDKNLLSPKEMIKKLGKKNVNFVVKSSLDFFDDNNNKFDFIFLDGPHSEDYVFKEVPRALDHLKKNGILLLHDYYPEGKSLYKGKNPILGPYNAIKNLRKKNLKIKPIPLGKLPWKTKLNSNSTSLCIIDYYNQFE